MNVEKIQQMLTTTERQNTDVQREALAGLSGQLRWEESPWNIVHFTAQRYLQTLTAKVYVLSGSVLSLGGKIRDYLESARIWEQERISVLTAIPENRELDNLSGQPFVFE